MKARTGLVPIVCKADASTYVKLMKRADKNGVPVRSYIASRFSYFFGNGVCNTRAKGTRKSTT